MKRKMIPVLVALALILVIGGVAAGSFLIEKYSYSEERVNLQEYFQVTGDELAIVLQDELVPQKARLQGGICYFDLETVRQYFNEAFYADVNEDLLLYTTALEVVKTAFGSTLTETQNGTEELPYVTAYEEDGRVYVAADYVKRYTNLSVELFEHHVQVYTQWGVRQVDTVKKDTAVRLKGGIKSPILCDVTEGTELEILETMETWSKVKTADSIIGYVENKLLTYAQKGEGNAYQEIPVTDYQEPEYTSIAMDGKVSLGWHAIGGIGGNDTLYSVLEGTKGLNVIAPTWFSLNDNEGHFRSFADTTYVKRAHEMGYQVWGVVDDFNYNNENNAGLDVAGVLSHTSRRQTLVSGLIQTALQYDLDGINVDFEKVTEESGPHFIQFLRELSVQCRKKGLVLSVDNYVPFHFNDYYRLDIQGKIVDYVIIMGYDEHWHGSGDPGSVASIGYVENGISRALTEVPANKLMNALPLYTILWKTEGAQVTDEYLTIRNTADFLSRMNVTPQWDEETGQNYAQWTSGNATYQIWIEDVQSIAVKLNVMSASDLAGVAVWRLGYGTEAVGELINGYVNQ